MAAPRNPSAVQVQPNSTGEAIETTAVTQPGGIVVYRQIVSSGDPNFDGSVQGVTGDFGEALVYDQQNRDVLLAILTQMRIHNALLITGFGLKERLESMEQDPTFALPLGNLSTITRH